MFRSVLRRRRELKLRQFLENAELSCERNVAGLSIGDGELSMAICRMQDHKGMYPLAYSKAKLGLGRHYIPSLDDMTAAIQNCFDRIRMHCRMNFSRFYLGIPSWDISYHETGVEIPIEGEVSRINEKHVERLMDKIRKNSIPESYVVLDIIPRYFVLDDKRSVRDPVGMHAEKLSLQALLICADVGLVNTILECLQKLGIRVDQMVSAPVAASTGTLSEEERETGVVLVDVGQMSAYCSFHYHRQMFNITAVDMGGHRISENISRSIGTSYLELERIVQGKEQWMLDDSVDSRAFSDSMTRYPLKTVSTSQFHELIKLSSEEMASLLFENLNVAQGHMDFATAGIVFIGENYLSLKGIYEVTKSRLGMPIRIGNPQNISECRNGFIDPSYVRLSGLIMHSWFNKSFEHYYLKKYYESPVQYLHKEYRTILKTKLIGFIQNRF